MLSALLDSTHGKHADARAVVAALDMASPKYVSVVALAELTFGQRLIEAFTGTSPAYLAAILTEARRHALLDITRHTAAEYADLKANLAKMYLDKALRRDRPRWIENWVDKATGQVLQVDENDLWMCAQVRERDLVMITADAKMERVSKADARVKLQII
jgi:predicted nucleic acid-binding protein